MSNPLDFQARVRQAMDSEPAPRRVELRRMADAARHVIDRMVASQAPVEVLAAAAEQLEAMAAALEAYPQGALFEGFAESANAGDPHAFFDHSPLIGRSNPVAPPIELAIADGMVVGAARFGSAYEGPPRSVHGGFIAAAFDEVLGMTQSLSGKPGMTARLAVDYRRPTPLHEELRFEGELERIEGRKIFTRGRLLHGETLCSEAEGLFISVDFAAFAQRMRAQGQDGNAPDV